MEFDDYVLLKKGFLGKRIYEQQVLREAVLRIVAPWVKDINRFTFWSLQGDDKLKKEFERASRWQMVNSSSYKLLNSFKQNPDKNINVVLYKERHGSSDTGRNRGEK